MNIDGRVIGALAVDWRRRFATTRQPLEVACFGKPDDWPEEAWRGCTFSQQALIASLHGELEALREAFGARAAIDDRPPRAAREWIAATRDALRAWRAQRISLAAKHLYDDDSAFTGDEDYAGLSRAEVTRFYRQENPGGRAIDIDRATVQVEAFGWRSASFRIDVLFAQRPSFLPLDTSFTMAHRLWMRRSGKIIKSEPVYRAANLAPGVSEATLPAVSQGFYPGLEAYRGALDRIDAALRAVGRIGASKLVPASPPTFLGLVLRALRLAPRPPPEPPGPWVDVGDGLRSLDRYQGAIVEAAGAFRITLDSARSELSGAFGPSVFITFEIDKASGEVSPLQTRRYTPPGLQ